MSSHSSFSLPAAPQLPNQSFYGWLRSEIMLYISELIGFIATVSSLIYYFGGAKEQTDKLTIANIQSAILFLNIVFILGFILMILHLLDNNDSGHHSVKRAYERIFHLKKEDQHSPELLKDGIKQMARFKKNFLAFWISTLLLYISFIFANQVPENFKYADTIVLTKLFLPFVFNTISLLFIFKSFIVLYLPSRYTRFQNPEILEKIATWAMLSIGLIFLGWIAIGPQYHEWMDHDDLKNMLQYLDAAGGALNAVVIALLVARIDSKLIGLPSWLISLLYLYAAIQPLFIAFDQSSEIFEMIKTSALMIAFVLKLYFFLIIMYVLQTGRMLNYLYCANKMVSIVDKELDVRNKTIETENIIPEHSNIWIGFIHWSSKKFKKYPVHIFLLFTFSCIMSVYYVEAGTGKEYIAGHYLNIEHLLHLLHIPLLVFFIYSIYKSIRKKELMPRKVKRIHSKIFGRIPDDKTLDEALGQLKEFKKNFLLFWVSMLILYVFYFFEKSIPYFSYTFNTAQEGITASMTAAANDANRFVNKVLINSIPDVLGSMFIFWCFIIMYKPGMDDKARRTRILLRRYSFFAWMFLIALFFIGASSIQPDPHTGLCSAQHLQAFAILIEAVGDTLTAVCLALLAARLDSILVDLRSSLITTIYLYASVQPLFVTTYQFTFTADSITTILFLIVFVLKIYFFWLIMYAIQTGRLTNYLLCFPSLEKEVDSVFDNQFVIKMIDAGHGEPNARFNFLVTNHNKATLKRDHGFENREDCRKEILKLQDVARQGNVEFQKKQIEPDNYWIEIFEKAENTGKKHLICFSECFKTQEEANDFLHEVQEKLPTCKLDFGC